MIYDKNIGKNISPTEEIYRDYPRVVTLPDESCTKVVLRRLFVVSWTLNTEQTNKILSWIYLCEDQRNAKHSGIKYLYPQWEKAAENTEADLQHYCLAFDTIRLTHTK